MLVTITSINTEGSIIDERLGERGRFYFFKVDGPDLQDTISYTYDPVGNRTKMIDQDGGITTYQYDALNRLVSLTNPRGETTTYSYYY